MLTVTSVASACGVVNRYADPGQLGSDRWAALVAASAGWGVWALVLAVGVHGVSKATTAGLAGGARYFWWLAPGLALHTAVAVVGLWLQR